MLVLFVWVLVVIWLLGCFVGVVVGVFGVCGFACVGYGVLGCLCFTGLGCFRVVLDVGLLAGCSGSVCLPVGGC